MKKKWIFGILCVSIILMSFFLVACAQNNINNADTYISSQDSQYGFISKDLFEGITESPNGYYFLSGTVNCYLYFYDNNTKKVCPVCNKPDCLHADEPDSTKIADCNAFLGLYIRFMNYYNDHIYYVSTVASQTGEIDSLFREEPDGTGRKLIYKFREPVSLLQIHRGYAYYSTVDEDAQSDPNSTAKRKFALYRINLDNPGNPEILYNGDQILGQLEYMLCYGNSVYYSIDYYTDASMEHDVFFINKTNIETGKTTKIADNGGGFLTIFKNHLVFASNEKDHTGTFICDLDGNNLRKISELYGNNSANDNNLFIDTYPYSHWNNKSRSLLIVDDDFNIIKTVSLSEIDKPGDDFLGCCNDYCFFESRDGSNQFGDIESIKYIPVDKITDDMKLSTLYQFVPKVPNVGVTTSN